jgi:hypothetical protein
LKETLILIFNVEKLVSLSDIRDMVVKRDGVLKRFGPCFRDPKILTKQDYLEFLSFDHNHHWTGLERLGRKAADEIDNLQSALAVLVDETLSLAQRFDFALAHLIGVGNATLTPILLVSYPERYGVWNGTSEAEMRERGLWPAFPRNVSQGQKYELINAALLELASQHQVDLWTLDALWWGDKLERQNTGKYKGAWSIAIWEMADQAEQTAKQANGQIVERTLKNKDLRLSKEALMSQLEKLLRESGYRCAISGLLLQPKGPDDQLRPSLDRIDSSGHYEADNLQVVARFINFWKNSTPDAEFRRQLALVQRE